MSKISRIKNAFNRFYCDLFAGYTYSYTLDELKEEIIDIILDNCLCCHRPKGTGHKMDCSYREEDDEKY